MQEAVIILPETHIHLFFIISVLKHNNGIVDSTIVILTALFWSKSNKDLVLTKVIRSVPCVPAQKLI